jgi:hypothetical protein
VYKGEGDVGGILTFKRVSYQGIANQALELIAYAPNELHVGNEKHYKS